MDDFKTSPDELTRNSFLNGCGIRPAVDGKGNKHLVLVNRANGSKIKPTLNPETMGLVIEEDEIVFSRFIKKYLLDDIVERLCIGKRKGKNEKGMETWIGRLKDISPWLDL